MGGLRKDKLFHPFIPADKDIDCKKYFCAAKNSKNVGIKASMAPAISWPRYI